MSDDHEQEESYEPLEARGEDQDIDLKATEEQFYHGEHEDRGESRIRKMSETIIEAVEAAAEKIAEGSRHISDHWKDGWKEDESQTPATVLGGGEKK